MQKAESRVIITVEAWLQLHINQEAPQVSDICNIRGKHPHICYFWVTIRNRPPGYFVSNKNHPVQLRQWSAFPPHRLKQHGCDRQIRGPPPRWLRGAERAPKSARRANFTAGWDAGRVPQHSDLPFAREQVCDDAKPMFTCRGPPWCANLPMGMKKASAPPLMSHILKSSSQRIKKPINYNLKQPRIRRRFLLCEATFRQRKREVK